MTRGTIAEWVLAGMASVAIAAHASWLCGGSAPPWLLPLGFALAFAVVRPRWSEVALSWSLVAVAAIVAVLAAGCLLTPPRSWDGLTTWLLLARALGESGAPDTPFFVDHWIHDYGRGYPLLQPLLQAQLAAFVGERPSALWFPLWFVLLLAVVDDAARRLSVQPALRRTAVACLLLTPMLLGPAHGAVDSGFADLLVLLLVTAAVAAILCDDARSLLWPVLLLPLAKQEGVVHALLLLAVAQVVGKVGLARTAAAGTTVALLLWLPLRARWLDGAIGAWTFVGALVAPVSVLGAAALLRGALRRWPRATPIGAGLLVAVGVPWSCSAAMAPAWAAIGLPSPSDTAAGLPAILLACLQQPVFVRRFGFVWVALAVALLVARRDGTWRRAAVPLAVVAGGAAAVFAFLATRPIEQQDLLCREGLPRYLSQLLGAAWLAIAVLAAPQTSAQHESLARRQ